MAAPPGLAQDHTRANTFWGAIKSEAKKAGKKVSDIRHKVLKNRYYFWTFDKDGNVEHTGEMRLTSTGKWSGSINDSAVEITVDSRSPNSPARRVDLGKGKVLHAKFDKTTPRYLYEGDDASNVMFVLHPDKNTPSSQSALAQLASSTHNKIPFVPVERHSK